MNIRSLAKVSLLAAFALAALTTLPDPVQAQVAAKVEAALAAGLEPIVCVGESLEQRQAGEAVSFVIGQLRNSLPASLAGQAFNVAYEPLWLSLIHI